MAKTKHKPVPFEGIRPPPEQASAFEESWQIADGKRARAYRRTPVIETLPLTARQHAALVRYRDACEERSPFRDSLDKALHGRSNGNGLPPGLLMAKSEQKWLDGILGDLHATIHAIAVEDKTPSEWAIELYGSVTRREQRGPWNVIRIKPRQAALKLVQAEIDRGATALANAMGI